MHVGRALDELWTTGCSGQCRTTARCARLAIFTDTYADARTGLDQLTVPVDETTNPDEVVSVLAHRLLSG